MPQRQLPLIKPGEPITADWANNINREIERLNSAQTRNANGRIVYSNRAGVYSIEESGQAIRFARISRRNCCVDQLSLNKNALTDGRFNGANYVTGYIIHPVTGSDIGSEVDIFPSVTMVGFLCYNATVAVVSSYGAWVAVGPGIMRATATLLGDVDGSDDPEAPAQAMLFDELCPGGSAGTAGNTDGMFEVESPVYARSCDTFVSGTTVVVSWQRDNCDRNKSRLVIEDACCPPAPSSGTA